MNFLVVRWPQKCTFVSLPFWPDRTPRTSKRELCNFVATKPLEHFKYVEKDARPCVIGP
jgi:hypothetical protein